MSEKVKITQEQADWLERYELTQDQIDHYIDIQPFSKRPDSPIVDWGASKLAKALYIGYEVEPEINDGDFLLHIPMNVIGKVINGVIHWSDNIENDVEYINKLIISGEVRHATPEEIAKEKERDWWAKHGREVKEVKKGDIIHDLVFDQLDEVMNTHKPKDKFKVVCFAEDRKDVDHGE